MFVILTSKPGQYHTEISDGVRPVEAYDFRFCSKKLARFVIAELMTGGKIRVIDDTPPAVVNEVPSKFFEKFATVEAARHALQTLVVSGRITTELVRRDAC